MGQELIGYSLDDLAYSLDVMEQATPIGGFCQVQVCGESPPSVDEIASFYAQISSTGHYISYPTVSVQGDVAVTSFNIRRDAPYEQYQWQLLVPLIGSLAVPALIAFGILRIEKISSAIVPLLLIAGGILIVTVAIVSKPATAYIQKGGKIPMLPATIPIEGLNGHRMTVTPKWKNLSEEETELLHEQIATGQTKAIPLRVFGSGKSLLMSKEDMEGHLIAEGFQKRVFKLPGTRFMAHCLKREGEREIWLYPKTKFKDFQNFIMSKAKEWSGIMNTSVPDFHLSTSDIDFVYLITDKLIVLPGKMARLYNAKAEGFDNLLFWVAHEFGHHVTIERNFKFKTNDDEENYVNKLATYLTGITPVDAYTSLYNLLPEVWKQEVGKSLEEAIRDIPKDISVDPRYLETIKYLPKTKHDPVKYAESILSGNLFDEADLPIYNGSSGLNPLGVPDAIWGSVFERMGGKWVRMGDLYMVSGGTPEAEPGLLPAVKKPPRFVRFVSGVQQGSLISWDSWQRELKGMISRGERPPKIEFVEDNENIVAADLAQSIREEIKATYDYGNRAHTAEGLGDKKTAELYKHVADEEDQHRKEFTNRLKETGGSLMEFMADSPEFLAETLNVDGWRDKIDQAFMTRIEQLRGK